MTRRASSDGSAVAESATPSPPVLQVAELCVTFGGLKALDDVTFDVPRGEVLGLIGPNGAGKTTCFNAITGLIPPTSGSIRFAGAELVGKRPDQIARAGIGRTFQHVAVVPSLTVRENVAVGAHKHGSLGWGRAALGIGVRREERMLAARAEQALIAVGLGDLADRPCSDLGLPSLKRVEIARALAAEPTLLLLDEPANGLTHSEVDELGAMISAICADQGVSVVLVEHHMGLVRAVAQQAVVLDFGRVLAEGRTEDVLAHDAVVDAYLGRAVTS